MIYKKEHIFYDDCGTDFCIQCHLTPTEVKTNICSKFEEESMENLKTSFLNLATSLLCNENGLDENSYGDLLVLGDELCGEKYAPWLAMKDTVKFQNETYFLPDEVDTTIVWEGNFCE